MVGFDHLLKDSLLRDNLSLQLVDLISQTVDVTLDLLSEEAFDLTHELFFVHTHSSVNCGKRSMIF